MLYGTTYNGVVGGRGTGFTRANRMVNNFLKDVCKIIVFGPFPILGLAHTRSIRAITNI